MTIAILTLFVIWTIITGYLAYKYFKFNENSSEILSGKLTHKLYKETNMMYLCCYRLYSTEFEKPKLFLIDTGATANFIREDLLQDIYPNYKKHIIDDTNVLTANGEITLNKLEKVPIKIKNMNSFETRIDFTVLNNTTSLDYLSEETGYDVIGILGSNFLKKNHCCLDFGSFKIIRYKWL